MEIKGKVFIVTGGASGLGEGTARMLALRGGTVVIADMQADKGEAVARDIGGSFMRCDVSSEADGQAVVDKAVSLGKLMGLVNCAGIAPAEKTVGKNGAHSLALFSKTITVNLLGSFNMIRLAAQAMSQNTPEVTGERGAKRAARQSGSDGNRRLGARHADPAGGRLMRVLLVDDERLARAELRRLLAAHPDVEIVGEAVSAAQAVTQVGALQPDLLLLDVQMPGGSGFDLLAALIACIGLIPLLVLTMKFGQ
eukprot:gene41611-51547_t